MATINLETVKLIGNGVLDAKHVAVLMQADLLAEEGALDPIQMSRVCAIMSDAEELVFKGDKDEREQFEQDHPGEPMTVQDLALSQVEQLYPQAYEDGTQFRHPGGIYSVDIKRKLRLTDDKGKPLQGKLYTQIRAIDAEKKLHAQETARLTRLRAEVIDQYAEAHPKKAKTMFDIKRTLKVMRSGK